MAAGNDAVLQAGSSEECRPTHNQRRLSSVGEQAQSAAQRLQNAATNHTPPAETATEAAARGAMLPAPELLGGLAWRWLDTQPSGWTPDAVSPTLNLRLDGRIVPSAAVGGARVSFSHLVVLDGFFGEPERQELMGFLAGGSAAAGVVDERDDVDGAAGLSAAGGAAHAALPGPRWARATADRVGLQPTWGLKEEALRELATADLAAVREVQTRLARLYPDYAIAHMPSEAIQEQNRDQTTRSATASGISTGNHGRVQRSDASAETGVQRPLRSARTDAGPDPTERDHVQPRRQDARPLGDQEHGLPPSADCDQFVGNAAVYGDCFRWHIDADPAGFPAPSPWTDAYGDYCNGEPGRPLLVSLLLYLDAAWPRDWAAETLFLDDGTDCGVAVRPRRYRAVLMDQDVLHRVSTPSQLAGGRPRFSLVWKLTFLPRDGDTVACLARPEWGPSTAFGTAARLEAMQRAVASRKRKASMHTATEQPQQTRFPPWVDAATKCGA